MLSWVMTLAAIAGLAVLPRAWAVIGAISLLLAFLALGAAHEGFRSALNFGQYRQRRVDGRRGDTTGHPRPSPEFAGSTGGALLPRYRIVLETSVCSCEAHRSHGSMGGTVDL